MSHLHQSPGKALSHHPAFTLSSTRSLIQVQSRCCHELHPLNPQNSQPQLTAVRLCWSPPLSWPKQLQSDKILVPRLQDQRSFSVPGARLHLLPEHQHCSRNSTTLPSHLTELPFFGFFLNQKCGLCLFQSSPTELAVPMSLQPTHADAVKLSCGTFLLSVLQLSSISTTYSFSNNCS